LGLKVGGRVKKLKTEDWEKWQRISRDGQRYVIRKMRYRNLVRGEESAGKKTASPNCGQHDGRNFLCRTNINIIVRGKRAVRAVNVE